MPMIPLQWFMMEQWLKTSSLVWQIVAEREDAITVYMYVCFVPASNDSRRKQTARGEGMGGLRGGVKGSGVEMPVADVL